MSVSRNFCWIKISTNPFNILFFSIKKAKIKEKLLNSNRVFHNSNNNNRKKKIRLFAKKALFNRFVFSNVVKVIFYRLEFILVSKEKNFYIYSKYNCANSHVWQYIVKLFIELSVSILKCSLIFCVYISVYVSLAAAIKASIRFVIVLCSVCCV